jgi:Tol biopolymer transport system component
MGWNDSFSRILGGIACLFCAAASGCGGSSGSVPISATATYDAFANPTSVAITGYSGDAMEPFISKDGQYLFFNNRNDPSVNTDLFFATRVDDATFTFLGPVPGAIGPTLDAVASLDTFGNLYFVSTRSYSTSLSTVYSGAFTAAGVGAVSVVPGVSQQKSGIVNFDAEISGDGQTLWFDDGDYSTGSLTAASIVIAQKSGASFVRLANSAALLATMNNGDLNYAPSISVDGLELFFTRVSAVAGATPGIYRATRADASSAFGAPELVTGAIGFVEAPSLSADGRLLYFHKLVNGTFVIQVVRR